MTAIEYIEWCKNNTKNFEEKVKKFALLSDDEKFLVTNKEEHEAVKSMVFLPKETHVSENGRWKLVVEETEGGWTYSKMKVYDNLSGVLIASITRNYRPIFFWMLDHKVTGNDYLITGWDYQGITFINLTKGTTKHHYFPKAEIGFGWCFVDAKLSTDRLKLILSGCIWAGPYEYKVFDWTDPDSITMSSFLPEYAADCDFNCDSQHNTIEVNEEKIVYLYNMRVHKESGKNIYELENEYSKLWEVVQDLQEKGASQNEITAAEKVRDEHAYMCDEDDDEKFRNEPREKITYYFDSQMTETWQSEEYKKHLAMVNKWQEDSNIKSREIKDADTIYQFIMKNYKKLAEGLWSYHPSRNSVRKGETSYLIFKTGNDEFSIEWGDTWDRIETTVSGVKKDIAKTVDVLQDFLKDMKNV